MSTELDALRRENQQLRALTARLLVQVGRHTGELVEEQDGPEEVSLNVVAGDGSGTPLAPRQTAAERRAALANQVGESYMAWCRAGSPLVSRGFMFERALRSDMPEARVSSLYRQGSRFSSTAMGEPEYWRVDVEGGTFLLPQPLSRDQFREANAVAFETTQGTVPLNLSGCRAAALVAEGGTHGVDVRGDLR